MKYIIGQDRNQATIFPISLDEAIDQDNEVRVLDLFVDSLDIEKMVSASPKFGHLKLELDKSAIAGTSE